jgi:hypothetical protein
MIPYLRGALMLCIVKFSNNNNNKRRRRRRRRRRRMPTHA